MYFFISEMKTVTGGRILRVRNFPISRMSKKTRWLRRKSLRLQVLPIQAFKIRFSFTAPGCEKRVRRPLCNAVRTSLAMENDDDVFRPPKPVLGKPLETCPRPAVRGIGLASLEAARA